MDDLSRTIPSVLASASQQWPEQIAVQDGSIELSFSELQDKARLAAKAIMATGLEPGDRFAIWAPNIHEWIWTAIGGMMAGGVLVPLNTRYRGIEAGDILRRSQARLLFTTQGFLDTDYPAMLLKESLPNLERIIVLRGESSDVSQLPINQFLELAEQVSTPELDTRTAVLNGESISDILYTSGTTGAPKGVVSLHGQTVDVFDAWSTTVGLQHGDRYLVVNPFFHSFGYKAGWLSCLIKGATALPMAVFNPEQTLHIIEQEKISFLPGAPTIFQTLLAEKSLATTDITSLRCAVTGAASVPEHLVYDMKTKLGFDEVFTAYGLTECPVVSITQPGDEISLIANTAGIALPQTLISVVDDNNHEVAANELGSIKVKGFNVMHSYFENPEATSNTIDQDGWLDTGDIGWKNEQGYIKVTDRAKDMFICGGFNCYPAEIENLLLRHEQILDVAVVGVEDSRLGEVGQAYAVFAKNPPTHDELKDWAREHMANFKVPRAFIGVDELPRNASGKVQKFKLVDIANKQILS